MLSCSGTNESNVGLFSRLPSRPRIGRVAAQSSAKEVHPVHGARQGREGGRAKTARAAWDCRVINRVPKRPENKKADCRLPATTELETRPLGQALWRRNCALLPGSWVVARECQVSAQQPWKGMASRTRGLHSAQQAMEVVDPAGRQSIQATVWPPPHQCRVQTAPEKAT